MNKVNMLLTLRVPANTDRSEFEPDAVWGVSTRHSTVLVSQQVKREGGYLVGATGAYREDLADVLSDSQRFCSLVVDQSKVVL